MCHYIKQYSFFRVEEVEALSDSRDLCISGDCLEMLQRTGAALQVIPYVKVMIGVLIFYNCAILCL